VEVRVVAQAEAVVQVAVVRVDFAQQLPQQVVVVH
jgi:hypothetical protein